jgi:hypothetical protein
MSIEEEIREIEEKIDAARKEIKKIERYKLVPAINKREKLRTKQAEEKLANLNGTIDWEWLLDGSFYSSLQYNESVKQLEILGLTRGGYFSTTQQYCLNIKIRRNNKEEVDRMFNSIQLLLPYLKPVEKDYIILEISEETLCEHGVYSLKIEASSKEKSKVTKTTYGFERVIKEFSTLKEALEYISIHHYYNDEWE